MDECKNIFLAKVLDEASERLRTQKAMLISLNPSGNRLELVLQQVQQHFKCIKKLANDCDFHSVSTLADQGIKLCAMLLTGNAQLTNAMAVLQKINQMLSFLVEHLKNNQSDDLYSPDELILIFKAVNANDS